MRTKNTLAVTTLRVFRLHLSVLLPCEWWGRRFLHHSNIEAVLNKRQSGDSPRTTKPKPKLAGGIVLNKIETIQVLYLADRTRRLT